MWTAPLPVHLPDSLGDVRHLWQPPVSSSQLALDETPGASCIFYPESLRLVGRPGKWARPSWKQDSQEGWSSLGYLSRALSFNPSMKLHRDFLGQGV